MMNDHLIVPSQGLFSWIHHYPPCLTKQPDDPLWACPVVSCTCPAERRMRQNSKAALLACCDLDYMSSCQNPVTFAAHVEVHMIPSRHIQIHIYSIYIHKEKILTCVIGCHGAVAWSLWTCNVVVFLAVFRYLMCSLKPGCFHCAEMQHSSQLQIHVLRFVKTLGTNTDRDLPHQKQSKPSQRLGKNQQTFPSLFPGPGHQQKHPALWRRFQSLDGHFSTESVPSPSEQMLSARVNQLKTLVDRWVDIRRCALISHSFGV